ncbi:hypothetical protein HYH03_005748 [Edaphochlamys debaryana]|uniref:Thioredoxin domain-containing protein n=1 Tax=Edaphochlamys debaryana TaxID=47281 RepID=A0A835Y8G9_9CHLO|nr:hypothetical protein HYH03_005748 [Edaphochlamys debaryana]|eukprot:KAG2496146.1 hypothetical protein HYH03_005748 [Edaphochlamys debaryana]
MASNIQQAIIEQTVAALAHQMEQQVDREIQKLDNLGEDDMEAIRQKRMAEMKIRQGKMKEWVARGHGEYQDIADEKEFFAAMKGEERMVCHFYRENWPCKVMDKHMDILAKKHLETKFCRINAEKSPFLTERLKIWMLPTLALVQNEKTVDYVVGLDQLGGKDDFDTSVLAERLAKSEMIDYDWGPKAAAAAPKGIRKGGKPSYKKTESDEDSDFD